MSVNENLITVKANHPDPNVDNVEVTFPVSDENWENFISYLGKGNKAVTEGFNLRTLTPRNRYGSAGMPVEDRIAKLHADLAKYEALLAEQSNAA